MTVRLVGSERPRLARLPRRRLRSGSPQPCVRAPLPSPPEKARPFPSSPARPWRNGSRTRGDEDTGDQCEGWPPATRGVWPVAAATPARGRGPARRETANRVGRIQHRDYGGRGWLRPRAVAATRWRTGGLHRPNYGDDPTCRRIALLAERELVDEYEQQDQSDDRADDRAADDPRHPGHSERHHHRTTSGAKFLSRGSSSPLVIGTVVRGTPVPLYALSCWQAIRGRAAGKENR